MRYLLIATLSLLPGWGIADPPRGGSQTVHEHLVQSLGELLEAMREGDQPRLDALACTDLFARHRGWREWGLGRVHDAEDPAMLKAMRRHEREAIQARFDDLARKGLDIAAVERVEFAEAAPGAAETLIFGRRGAGVRRPVTAYGHLQLRCEPGAQRLDIGIVRVGQRWCLRP